MLACQKSPLLNFWPLRRLAAKGVVLMISI